MFLSFINKKLFILIFTCFAAATVSAAPLSPEKIKERFDEKIGTFLADRGFPGAVVSIYKNGNQILNQGYGSCYDTNKIYPIASLSKLFTEIAIKKLISEKKLLSNTRVHEYLGLPYQPLDERIKLITIKNLLEHKGGWDRSVSPDPLFMLQKLCPNSNVRQIRNEEFMRLVLTKISLIHNPGEHSSYSNFGYFLLGAVIEKAAHMNYLEYLNEMFAAPLNITLYQAKTPSEYAREIPFRGCFSLELSTSSFGLAAKISDVAYFFSHYDPNGSRRSPNKDKINWFKDGSLPGTATLMLRQRINNVIICVYIPDRDENNWVEDNGLLKTLIDNTANSVGL